MSKELFHSPMKKVPSRQNIVICATKLVLLISAHWNGMQQKSDISFILGLEIFIVDIILVFWNKSVVALTLQ